MTWPEHENPARQDGNFLTRFRVAANTASLLPDRKRPEPTDFNGFPFFQTRSDTLQYIFQQIG
ncbi:MAG: hypothetical protein QOD93_5763 [Acetobacteraceae bacterium]|nr:hypothetical protein [Acetobacteraceae bacterium]MEA2772801.1 hypothetical protein [Acetobacteraceae bacterium]